MQRKQSSGGGGAVESAAVDGLGSKGAGLVRRGVGIREGLRRFLGLDRAIVFTIMAYGWSSLAGLVTLLLISRFLTSAEQGYYYTLGSLVALQIVFELGFSLVILQMASHERAHLTLEPDGSVSGSAAAHGRLASVLQKAVQWYSIAAVLMFCTLVPTGFYFFRAHPQAGAPVAWRLPWLMVVLAASVGFQLGPLFSFLEGCGHVSRVARTRVWQALLGSALAWAALLTHHGLFAPALTIFGQVSVGAAWLWTQRKFLLGLLRHSVGAHRVDWRSEVWPFQWRIALTWMCGFFVFQLFVPVLFAFRGPVPAGQMGMSLGIVNVLTSVAISWMDTKAAPFGQMIARKDYRTLDETFFRALMQSLAVSVVFSLMGWGVLLLLRGYHVPIASRMLAPLPFGMLLLAMVVNHTMFSVAVYLRSHKQEKMLWQSICRAVGAALLTYLLGKRFGETGIVSGYLGLSVIGLVLALYTFFYYRRVWHAQV